MCKQVGRIKTLMKHVNSTTPNLKIFLDCRSFGLNIYNVNILKKY